MRVLLRPVNILKFTFRSFGINYVVDLPDQGGVALGSVLPWCHNCDKEALIMATGAVGAIIMPHNLYLHSGLVTSYNVDRSNSAKVHEANFYTSIESAISIAVSFIINLIVISVFGNSLHGTTYAEVIETNKACNWQIVAHL